MIEFAPLTDSPQTLGDGLVTLPALQVVGADVVEFGRVTLPALVVVATAVYTETLGGEGLIVLPGLEVFASDASAGAVTVAGYGVARLPGLQVRAFDDPGLVPSDGTGLLVLPALTAAATGTLGLTGEGSVTLPALRLFGFEAAGPWGVVDLPALRVFGLQQPIAPDNWATLEQSQGIVQALVMESDQALLVDGLSSADLLTDRHTLGLLEQMALASPMSATAAHHTLLADAFGAGTLFRVIEHMLLADATALDAVLDVRLRQIVRLASALRATGAVSTRSALRLQLAEVLAADDLARQGFHIQSSETAAFADAATQALRAAIGLVDAALVSDALSAGLRLTVLLADSLATSSALSTHFDGRLLLTEGLSAFAELTLSGEQFAAWVLNPETSSVTTYANYGFNSFARFAGRYYGALDDGLYELDGNDDAGTPIDAVIRTGLSNFGLSAMKRMPLAYLGVRASGGLVLKAIVTDDKTGEKEAFWYDVTPAGTANVQETRVKLGKGLASVYWQFELTNVAGGDFELESLRLLPLLMNRRV